MPTLKQTKKFKIPIFLLYIFFIFTLGIAYAYLSSTLKINGIASIEGYLWPEGILPTIPEKTEEGSQFSDNFQSEYLEGTPISSNAQNRFENVQETYDVATSTYTITITKNYTFGQSFNADRESFNLNFTVQNMSNITWTNGNVTTDFNSNGNLLSNVSGTIDKTNLQPNETVTLNMQFTLTIYGSFLGVDYTDEIIYKINYLVDGEVKTTTVVISFVC